MAAPEHKQLTDEECMAVLDLLGRELKTAEPAVMGAVLVKLARQEVLFFQLPIVSGEVMAKADDVIVGWVRETLSKHAGWAKLANWTPS